MSDNAIVKPADVEPVQVKLYEATERAIARLGLNPVEIAWPPDGPLPFDLGWKYFRDVPLDEAAVVAFVDAMLEEYVARNGAGDVLHPRGLPLVHLVSDDGRRVSRIASDVDDTVVVRLRMYAGPRRAEGA